MTNIQEEIERKFTSTGKYDRRNTERIPYGLRNTEIGLQIALANMECTDGKMDMYQVVDFSSRLKAMIKKYNAAGIPLETITTGQGFEAAMNSPYYYLQDLDILGTKPIMENMESQIEETKPVEYYISKSAITKSEKLPTGFYEGKIYKNNTYPESDEKSSKRTPKKTPITRFLRSLGSKFSSSKS